MRAGHVAVCTLLATLGLSTEAWAEDAFVPWAPATAGLPSSATITIKKVYVHGIKPSVGMEESMGPPLSAAILTTVRSHAWSKGREIVSGDEVRLGSPNIATFIDACVSGPCVVEVARSVGCGVALSATVSKVGSTFLVDALAVDTRTSQVVARVTDRVKGKDASSLLDSKGLPRVTAKLLSSISKLPPDEVATAAVTTPPTATAAVTPPTTTTTPAATTTPPATTTTTPAATGTTGSTTTTAVDTTAATGTDTSTSTTTVETTDGSSSTVATETSTVEATEVESGSEAVGTETGTETTAAVEDPGTTTPVTDDEKSSLSAGVFIGAGVAGLGLVLAGGGGLALLNAVFADQELETQRHAENQVRAIIEQGQTFQTVGFVLLGVGAVALAVGAGVAGGSL
ncbi:MAG: hypothetical protein ABIJ09_14035 [Pseudomonadota bacterium]